MTPALVAVLCIAVYALGYRYYARFLSEKVFHLDDARETPAHTEQDGVDYVPTQRSVLFGHHFASITGLAPMLGPAVAVIWGWVPALIWVVLGALFIGCVHDFSALVVSLRARGLSVGSVAEGVIGKRARILFLLIIFFGVSLAMGVFVFVIAKLFTVKMYPQAVLPSGFLIIVALGAGYLLYRRGMRLLPVALVGFALELFGIWLGTRYPTMGFSDWPSATTWTWILLAYGFSAAVLPVWVLLQSRDFLNGLLLYLGVGLAYIGLFVGDYSFSAPAINPSPEGAPPMLPFVFIVIACGAASGFHGLVSSGTTAKQLNKESDARPIAYGGMIGESMLGLLAVLACTAGIGDADVWQSHYGSWHAAAGLPAKLGAFISGTTHFLSSLGIDATLGTALVAMVVVSFALTTLDSATRLLRFNIEELAAAMGFRKTLNRYLVSLLACASIAFFAFFKVGGKPAGLALWGLFGTTNQLLASLTLIMVTVYLRFRRWPTWPTALPAVFMLASTLIAMVTNLMGFVSGAQTADDATGYILLAVVGGILLLLGVWLVIEAAFVLMKPVDRVRGVSVALSSLSDEGSEQL
ncbi:MAG TPA: carbon starvation protein A [Myxococcales bacterium]|nr:carbon starvation protein A [Myxococcales bacterium]HIN85365.1 carbon starvation protein A [Myxococcales bacterium]